MCLFWQNYQLYNYLSDLDKIFQLEVTKTKSNSAKILDSSFLLEHLLIDATERRCFNQEFNLKYLIRDCSQTLVRGRGGLMQKKYYREFFLGPL